MTVYLIYSADEYELPLAVFDTQKECAEYLGLDTSSLRLYKGNPEHVFRTKPKRERVKLALVNI